MADINFTVNTRPLADRIDGVTREVGVVGGAVSALQVAVIAAENEAADTICQSIDSGFYLLMRSRFSQKLAQFSSTMSSRVGSMLETAQAIDRTHQQMLGDFNRIKARYVKLFDGLDRKLEERVRELDRDAMTLAKKRSSLLVEGQCREVPVALYCPVDTHAVTLKATSAHVKTRALDSIGNLSDGAHRTVEHEKKLRDILSEGQPNSAAPVTVMSVPVVFVSEESMTTPDGYVLGVTASPRLSNDEREAIDSGVRRNASSLTPLQGTQLAAVRERFMGKVAEAGLDARVAQTMATLFNESFTGSLAEGASDRYDYGRASRFDHGQAGDFS